VTFVTISWRSGREEGRFRRKDAVKKRSYPDAGLDGLDRDEYRGSEPARRSDHEEVPAYFLF
jgi:hypothetical protein